MTTPINTFQDILDAMQREPALRDELRRHLLTDDLLQVPLRLEPIEQDIATLKGDMAEVKGDVAVLKEDMVVVKDRLDTIDGRLDTIDGHLGSIDGRLDTMGGQISNLSGHDYESHVARNARRFFLRELSMRASPFARQNDNGKLGELIYEPELQGIITPQEADQLLQADLVFTRDEVDEYVLAEVSITVQQLDIDRARERAAILRKATTRPVMPLAIGARQEPDLDKGAVQILLVPEAGPQGTP